MIGIFDSGCGGLSVLDALRKQAPKADIVYFGDIANAPYGSRTPEELTQFVARGMQELAQRGAAEIIAACNSISLSVLQGAVGHGRLIEMTRPAARMMRAYAGERVLLLATPATIASGIYRDALWSIVDLDELPIRELAQAIEEERPRDDVVTMVRAALVTKSGKKYDKVLLGCTHYPLVLDVIKREVRDTCGGVLLDPAGAVAKEAVERFGCEGNGVLKFVISKDSHSFRNRIAPLFLETECSLEII